MTKTRDYESFTAHFSEEISVDLKKFVRDEVLLHSRYLFVHRVTSTIQRGYCTHCKSNHVINLDRPLKHNEAWQCEKCKSLVQVKQAGRGRGKMIDKAYVVWYEKSKSTPGAITATGYNVTMDYTENRAGVTGFDPVAKYVFEIGSATMMHRNYSYSGCYNTRSIRYGEGWSFASRAWSMIGKNSYTANSSQSIASIHTAIDGTQFKYSKWEFFSKDNLDLVYFFSVFSKYPFIEYLAKMGMHDIVSSMVNGYDLYRSINLRGKTMEKILGLSKQEVKEWKASGVAMKPIVLKTYKWFRKNGVAISWDTAYSCENLLEGSYYFDRLTYIQQYVSLDFILKYIHNQMKKHPKYNRTLLSTLITWKDYLEECKDLQMDLTSDKVLFPNNLHSAHQKTTRSIKIKNDEVINQKINNLQPRLNKLKFEKGGLLIRPAKSSIEMFDEGKALDHCVGRYAESYAKGNIIIMFIRKTDQEEKPFYTLEIDTNTMSVAQCRGLKNCGTTEEVKLFVEAFKKEKLAKKSRKNKIAQTA